MLYWILKPIGRLILFVFFKEVEVQGRENVPDEGPVIFAGNHPNMLLDPLLLAAYCQRKVHYLAKAPLFKNPLMAAFLKSCGVIPVYRRRDEADMDKNQSSFEACYQILEKGGAIGIFPEGTSHSETYLMELKTGVARIPLGAEKRNDYSLNVKILPVGLNFRDKDKFRSRVLVVYGEAMSLSEYYEDYEKESRETVRKVTSRVQKLMEEITLNIKSDEDATFVRKIELIYRKEFLERNVDEAHKNRLLNNLVFNQALVDAYDYFKDQKPDHIHRLKEEINNYHRMIERFDLHPQVVGYKISRPGALFYLLGNLLFFVATFPLALYGIINNFFPYRLPGWLAEKKSRYQEEIASVKILSGLIFFPLFYALQAAVFAYFAGIWWGLAYFATLPLAGFFALAYLDHFSFFRRGVFIYIRYATNRDLKKELEKKKDYILGELDVLSQEYLELSEEGKTSPQGSSREA